MITRIAHRHHRHLGGPQTMPADLKFSYRETDPVYAAGETMVLNNGDRIGFVRKTETGWHATDAELVGLRGVFKTRRNAALALMKRWQKLMGGYDAR